MATRNFEFPFGEIAVTLHDLFEWAPQQSRGLDDFPDVLQETLSTAEPLILARGGYRILSLDACNEDTLTLGGLLFETGKIITKPFRKADHVAVFACTAGPGIQTACVDFITKGESLKAYIMDTVGTVVVEKAMNRIATELEREAAQSGWQCTNRYSPGYCGWRVDEQQKLWSLLPAGYCGITLNAASLMTPVKSISGMIGLGQQVIKTPYACSGCNMKHCLYKKRPSGI